MYKFYACFLLSFLLLTELRVQSQCYIQIVGVPDTVCVGDTVHLFADGSCGAVLHNGMDGFLSNDFISYSTIDWGNHCNPSCDGTPYAWMGTSNEIPRQITSEPINVQPGCGIVFSMKYGEDGNPTPCEGPSANNEGVYLQCNYNYPTQSWATLNYWDPNGGHDSLLTQWHTYYEIFPTAGPPPTVQIRWIQDTAGGLNQDTWGIDNVQVVCPVWQFVDWSHGASGFSPPAVVINQDTSFIVTIHDTLNGFSASDTIFITALPSYPAGFLGNDTIVDAGQSLTLTAPSGAAYLWSTSETTNQIIIDSSLSDTNGIAEIWLELINIHGCIAIDTIEIFFDPNFSVNKHTKDDFRIFPNPGSGIFEIEFTYIDSEKKLSVYNANGKKVLELSVPKGVFLAQIDLRSFTDGIYVIHVNGEKTFFMKKIVKHK